MLTAANVENLYTRRLSVLSCSSSLPVAGAQSRSQFHVGCQYSMYPSSANVRFDAEALERWFYVVTAAEIEFISARSVGSLIDFHALLDRM
jgi:hypothetical protein